MISGTTEYEEVKATLLSLNGAPVWKIGNEIVTGFPTRAFVSPNCRKIYTSGPRCCGRCRIPARGGIAWRRRT